MRIIDKAQRAALEIIDIEPYKIMPERVVKSVVGKGGYFFSRLWSVLNRVDRSGKHGGHPSTIYAFNHSSTYGQDKDRSRKLLLRKTN